MIRLLPAAALIVLLTQSCAFEGRDDCVLGMMCSKTSAMARVTSGEVTATLAGGDPQTYRVGMECTVDFETLDTSSFGGYDSFATPPFTVCHSGDREISIASVLLHDLRHVKRDKTTYKPELNNGHAMAAVKFKVSQECSYALSADPLTVEVIEAQGTSASNHPYVTSDYFRRIAVHIEASGDHASCGSVTIVSDLVVEQAVSDIVTSKVECPCP